jgi:phosphohistidine phosphatase
MDFYLVRHGEAMAGLIDPSRPLTSAGREAVEGVARAAAAKDVRVAAIYHSGILRATQTAEILALHLAPSAGVATMTGLQPEDDPALAAAELAVAASPVMLVGHLPHMNRLAALLGAVSAPGEEFSFVPAMMACFSRDGSLWRLDWTITPASREAQLTGAGR